MDAGFINFFSCLVFALPPSPCVCGYEIGFLRLTAQYSLQSSFLLLLLIVFPLKGEGRGEKVEEKRIKENRVRRFLSLSLVLLPSLETKKEREEKGEQAL